MLRRWTVPGLSVTILAAAPAAAQVAEDLTVQPAIAQDYDRGRNVSVTEQPRPDYTALGIRFGSLLLYPRVEAGAGGTSNTYLAPDHEQASAFVYLRPSARLVTDWTRHFVQLSGGATLRDYIGQSPRNERLWNVDALGRLDLASSLTVQANGDISRNLENLFSGETTTEVAALSHYQRDYASLQATYTRGRGRAFVVGDYTHLSFGSVPLQEGGIRDQSDRDRAIFRVAGQVEYARSPSVALFAQLGGIRTNYDRGLLTGGPNLDSRGVRLLGGVNVDISGRIRGTIGVGYSIRDYDSSIYRTVRGLSIESTVQLFPSRRLTLRLDTQRTIEDASLNRRSYWNSRVAAAADYELLRNLILNASADYSHQDYLQSPLAGDIYRARLGGRYVASRRISLQGSLSYTDRSSNNAAVLRSANEARVEAGIAYQI